MISYINNKIRLDKLITCIHHSMCDDTTDTTLQDMKDHIEAILLRMISENGHSRSDENRSQSFDKSLTSLRNSPSTGNLVPVFGEGEQEISIAI